MSQILYLGPSFLFYVMLKMMFTNFTKCFPFFDIKLKLGTKLNLRHGSLRMGMSTMQTKFEIFTLYSYGEIDVQKVIVKI